MVVFLRKAWRLKFAITVFSKFDANERRMAFSQSVTFVAGLVTPNVEAKADQSSRAS